MILKVKPSLAAGATHFIGSDRDSLLCPVYAKYQFMSVQIVRAGLSSWTQELIILFGGGFCLVSDVVFDNCQDAINHAQDYSDYRVTK